MALSVPFRIILVAIGVHTLWGGNPVAIKFSLEVFPPLWTAFFRFVIGVLCVALWARLQGVPIWPRRGEWPALILIGLVFTVQIGLMNLGFDHTTAAIGSVLIATNPVFAAAFAHLLVAGDRLNAMRILGLLVACAGTAVVLLKDIDLASLDYGASGNWILLLSACLLGFRLATTARVLRGIDEARVAIWQMLISLPLFALGGALFEQIQWHNLAPAPVLGVVYQGVLVAGVAFMVVFHLMKRYQPSVIMSFNFISPVAGVLLSVWLLGEHASPALFVGMFMVAIGIWLIARRASSHS